MIKVYTNLNQIVTLQGAHTKNGKNLKPEDLSIIENGAIAFDDKAILWVGEAKDLPSKYTNPIDLSGHVLTPGLVDSHTHVVFGGDRAVEYTDRLNGTSYEEIARRGGGILFTMKETNNLPAEELFQSARKRILKIAAYGVKTLEVKSGYGLNLEKELELSLIIDRLKKELAPQIQIFNTFLAAHDVPKDFPNSSAYIHSVVIPLLQKLARLGVIDAVDIFHEKNYFNEQDVRDLFEAASALNIPRKIHADELNDNNGAALAVDFNALSADHLLKVSDYGINALAGSNTVATLLPGTAFFLGKPLAPARKLLDAGVRVAIASDYNPGSCHCDNVLLVASIAAAQLKLNQAEFWAALTLNAAAALGLKDQGLIRPGMVPRMSLFKTPSVSHISYCWGENLSVDCP